MVFYVLIEANVLMSFSKLNFPTNSDSKYGVAITARNHSLFMNPSNTIIFTMVLRDAHGIPIFSNSVNIFFFFLAFSVHMPDPHENSGPGEIYPRPPFPAGQFLRRPVKISPEKEYFFV